MLSCGVGRILTVVSWLVALAGLAALWVALTQLTPSPARATAYGSPTAPVRSRPAAPRTASGTWRVVEHLSAEHVAVIHVETDRLREARQIAVALVEPMKEDYAEMLVYFHRPGRRQQLPARRVQWSPYGGYTEMIYEQPASRPRGLAARETGGASADTVRRRD
jgi:hypothetical protein